MKNHHLFLFLNNSFKEVLLTFGVLYFIMEALSLWFFPNWALQNLLKSQFYLIIFFVAVVISFRLLSYLDEKTAQRLQPYYYPTLSIFFFLFLVGFYGVCIMTFWV